MADYFEACLKWCKNSKLVSNWVMVELTGLLNNTEKTIDQSPVTAEHLGKMLQMVDDDVISGKIAKTVFTEMAATGQPAGKIVEEKGLVQVSDADALGAIVDKVLADNSPQVTDYKNGKTKLIGYFVGQVMKLTKGQANPKMVNEILRKRLDS